MAGSYIHEIIGHVMEGKAGATQIEEYYAWAMAAMMAEGAPGITVTGNPGGDLSNFRDWMARLIREEHPYSALPLQLSQHGVDAKLETLESEIEMYTDTLSSRFGPVMYTYGSSYGSSYYSPPDDYFGDRWFPRWP